MKLVVMRHADAHKFLQRAEPWLLRAEVEHNLVLGVAAQLIARKSTPADVYLATVESSGKVVGCAFRTPPHKVCVTRFPVEAAPLLVDQLEQLYESIETVLGPEPQARAIAEEWARRKQLTAQRGLPQRLYELRAVRWPAKLPPGHLKVAEREDLETLVAWLEEFAQEVHLPAPDPRAYARQHIENRAAFLWVDGEPRTCCVWAACTRHVVRIGFVYTPARHRGNGYASACVASASQRAFEAGYQYCCLYTDLTNPTSNKIYQELGYVPVRDVIDYEIEK